MVKQKKQKEHLTHEWLRKQFKNNFQLTQQAIDLGRFYIHAGHEIQLKGILEEVSKNPQPDYVNELRQLEKEETLES